MSPNSWDASQSGGRGLRRRFVPGVYNYCDSWCERCQFQQHCRLFHDRTRYEEALAQGQAALDRFLFEDDPEDEPEDAELQAPTAVERAEFLAALDELDQLNQPPLSAEEERRIDAALEEKQRRKDAHPLAMHSAEYVEAVRGIVGPLHDLLGVKTGADPLALAALDAINHQACLLSAKIRRAVGSLVGSGLDEDDDRMDTQSDANGCAKLSHLVIAESREAWTMLLQSPPAAAEGLPLAMIERLDRLDDDLQVWFPRAMSFVRPGFDDSGR